MISAGTLAQSMDEETVAATKAARMHLRIAVEKMEGLAVEHPRESGSAPYPSQWEEYGMFIEALRKRRAKMLSNASKCPRESYCVVMSSPAQLGRNPKSSAVPGAAAPVWDLAKVPAHQRGRGPDSRSRIFPLVSSAVPHAVRRRIFDRRTLALSSQAVTGLSTSDLGARAI